jgi:hypothetical protein
VKPKAKPWETDTTCLQTRETGGSHLAVAHFVGSGALYRRSPGGLYASARIRGLKAGFLKHALSFLPFVLFAIFASIASSPQS